MDTDVVIDALRHRPHSRPLLEAWAARGLPAVSAVTYLEVYQGLRPGEEDSTEVFLEGLASIPLDAHIGRRAGLLLRDAKAHGLTVGIADAVVAATALMMGVPLLTNNVRHYPFPGLNVVKGAPG